MRLLTNSVGNVRGSASYTPFGEVMGSTAGSAFGFAGEQTDATGLQYLRARYYAPEQGRFLTTDPFGGRQAIPYSLHPYQYGYSNPLGYVDPDGKHACLAALGLAVVDGPSPVGDVVGIVACATQLAADATALALGTYAVTHPPEAAPITPENPDPAADVESFPLDAGIELPIYTPPGQVDNWWEDDGLDATPIDELVELHPEGISVEIPNIEVDIFPLWQEEEEQLFCASDGRQRPGRSGHAEQRRQEGRRVAQGFGDAQRAVRNDVFYDTRTDRFIVRGPRGREHIFEYDTGDQVTTVENRSHRQHNKLVGNGTRRRVTDSEYEQFRRLFPRN